MLHVGPRPTYDAEAAVAEAHLLGFSGDLQGQMLTVELIQWLRPVVRFQGNQALIRQLEKDRRTTIARVPLRDAAARIDAQ